LPNLKQTLVVPQPLDNLELDEVWSFVRRKGKRAWVWIALSFQSRQVVAMVVGDRSAPTCRKLWERLPQAYRHLTTYTDFWKAYQAVVPREQHQPSNKGSGLTGHMRHMTNAVERFNLTLRQRVGRMVRKTLSFSKSWAMHLLCLRLFVDTYNRYCLSRFPIEDRTPLTT
jgi:IS1 family transposase